MSSAGVLYFIYMSGVVLCHCCSAVAPYALDSMSCMLRSHNTGAAFVVILLNPRSPAYSRLAYAMHAYWWQWSSHGTLSWSVLATDLVTQACELRN
jgi:hypothetical protein